MSLWITLMILLQAKDHLRQLAAIQQEVTEVIQDLCLVAVSIIYIDKAAMLDYM